MAYELLPIRLIRRSSNKRSITPSCRSGYGSFSKSKNAWISKSRIISAPLTLSREVSSSQSGVPSEKAIWSHRDQALPRTHQVLSLHMQRSSFGSGWNGEHYDTPGRVRYFVYIYAKAYLLKNLFCDFGVAVECVCANHGTGKIILYAQDQMTPTLIGYGDAVREQLRGVKLILRFFEFKDFAFGSSISPSIDLCHCNGHYEPKLYHFCSRPQRCLNFSPLRYSPSLPTSNTRL